MANLAILGHATRGKEVIEILEMLGGINNYKINNTEENLLYCLREGDNIIIATYPNSSITSVFTLEEFLEKYPYKVGDKVRFSDSNTPFTISGIWWNNNASELICTLEEQDIDVSSVDLQPYKEETMEEQKTIPPYMDYDVRTEENMKVKGTLVEIDLTKELCVADEVEVILGDYEFVLKDGKTYFVKKKPKYPKTYVECAKLLGCFCAAHIDGYKGELLDKFQELLICRDAYWKIAGEQMGLGKPWEPYWTIYKHKFCLGTDKDKVIGECVTTGNRILAFPTAEIRDAFFENFKELIEECKELL